MDCLEGMKLLDDNSVDMVLTDPPYNINLIPQRGLTNPIENDNLNKEDFITLLNSCATEFKRILKQNTFFLTFCGWPTIPEYRQTFDKQFELKSMPIWIKNNFGIGYYTRPQYEPCLLYLNGNPSPLEKPISDVWKFNKVLKPIHSCEKPINLIQHIIRHFSKEGNLILDPFMGSGTTAIAALQTNRKFIGFEIDEKYCEIATKRIKPWLEQTRLSPTGLQ